jgi:putative tryptophan/tyrosine transport system substrate-binding protein
MRRRELIGLIGTAALISSRPGYGQNNTSLPLVGFLVPTKQDTEYARQIIAAPCKGLQEEGFTEGKNYSLAMRFANGDFARLPSLAKELGALKPRVIVAAATASLVAHESFPDLPVVFTAIADDPIALGFAENYARPGGMMTGNVMNAVGGEETITQKRIGFFKELVPGLTRLGMIARGPQPNPLLNGLATREENALRKAAAQFGFEFMRYNFDALDDLESAFASALRDNVSAFYISGQPTLFNNMSRVVSLVAASEKPGFGSYPEWGRAGLLVSYSTDLVDGYRHAGIYAGKILNGAKPADLPIEQADKFTLVINLKTAKSLGIVVPPTLLALADEVIE